MAWFKTLDANSTKDMYTILTFSNNASDGIFMPIMLLVIFSISLIGSVIQSKSFFRGLTISSFICSILSILMVIMNWLAPTYMYFAFFMTACGLIGTKLSESFS